jgi:putative ABC transport system permease protein
MAKFIDLLGLAGQGILHRRLRSWLTVIGVVIGIAAVVGLISVGLGFERTMKDQVSKIFGVDTFILAPEDEPGFALDFEYLTSLDGVRVAATIREQTGYVQGPADETGARVQGFLPVFGLTPELATGFPSFIGEIEFQGAGRLLEPGEANVAILGSAVAERLGASTGDTILVAGSGDLELEMTVIGVLAASEEEENADGGMGFLVTSGPGPDEVYIPYETMNTLWEEGDDLLFALVRTEEGADVDVVADLVEEALKARGSEVSSITYSDISSEIGQFTTIASMLLGGIAGISLLVGGVGVMNTMFTSVLERTQQIGVMKAVGAKNSHVWVVFLLESGLIGLVGGVVGSGLGLLLNQAGISLINSLGGGFNVTAVISVPLLMMALAGSFAVGAVAGLLPAWRASRLPVVDALRYE